MDKVKQAVKPAVPAIARLTQHASMSRGNARKWTHLLVVLPEGGDWFDVAACLPDEHAAVLAALRRQEHGQQGQRTKAADTLAKEPLIVALPDGCLSVWLRLPSEHSTFQRHGLLRRALKPLLDEHPDEIDIALFGADDFRVGAARAAAYVALLNGTPLDNWKAGKPARSVGHIKLHGVAGLDLARERALAEGNLLTRQLAWLPPNFLTPASYRKRIRALAKTEGWAIEEFDMDKLEKLKAGAFLAVARGSDHRDAAIVRLTYRPPVKGEGGKGRGKGDKFVALVGKGICFDTGGHNLKPARYMHNMHDDMNGSAVCLGILIAASRLRLPVRLEVWLAIAQNHLSPRAYTQNEVVTALNGTTIEVMHTDAEGRMVLADTLALAAKEKPAAIIDFATLTGSMAVALGDRMSGVIGNRDDLAARAVSAGQAAGERVVAFPMPEDYDEALDSQVADVKQCILEGEADHILAARFLSRFVADLPWLHVDLSASRCKGGLGAAGTELTGFGVGLGLGLVEGAAVTDTPGNVR